MKLLVFGKSGQLARALARDAGAVALGREDIDLAAADADIAGAIVSVKPDAVINAAAHTAVDKAESEPEAAFALNERAPTRMAQACAGAGIPFVHVSTDYVFDGEKPSPYVEDDPTAPLNVYGRSKLAGERAVLAAYPGAVTLRTSWVYAAEGGNFMRTMLRVAQTQDEVRVVADQLGAPTLANDLAGACVAAASALRGGAAGGVFHFTNAGETTWADFAEAIFALSGKTTRVQRITTAEYPTPARRPRNSRLNCGKIAQELGVTPRPWRDALAACLKTAT
jgi:dTDP-4-dehydrorhamnose reductase